MSEETLVYNTNITISGENYTVAVFCRQDGHHFARTTLSKNDVIINDGPSLDDALLKHTSLLPLAIHSRKIVGDIKSYPFKPHRHKL